MAATWNHYPKAPRHWKSVLPHGYFIVMEMTDDGDEVFSVYQGDYDDWRSVSGSVAVKLGEYPTSKAAKASI